MSDPAVLSIFRKDKWGGGAGPQLVEGPVTEG